MARICPVRAFTFGFLSQRIMDVIVLLKVVSKWTSKQPVWVDKLTDMLFYVGGFLHTTHIQVEPR